MIRRRRAAAPAALAAALLLLPAASGRAEEIERLVPQPVERAYRGRKVVIDFSRRSPHVTTMTVVAQPGGRERREFHGSHAVLVVDGAVVWQYLPAEKVVVKRPLRGEGGEHLRPEALRRSLASYRVRVTPAAPVAGRRSLELEFTPRQSGSRPSRRVWIDAATGLILRTEVYGADNRLAWLTVFEDLDYGPRVDPGAFTMRIPAGVRVVEAGEEPCLEPVEAARRAGVPLALPSYLPQGFERQCVRARREAGDGEVQALFGDGLSLLSLYASTTFRDPGAGEAEGDAAVRVGAVPGRWYQRGLVNGIAWRISGAHLALLGELSRAELERVAASVRSGEELLPAGRRP